MMKHILNRQSVIVFGPDDWKIKWDNQGNIICYVCDPKQGKLIYEGGECVHVRKARLLPGWKDLVGGNK